MQTWGLTDPGNIRQQNQDSYAIVPFGRDRVLHDRLRRHGRRKIRQRGQPPGRRGLHGRGAPHADAPA